MEFEKRYMLIEDDWDEYDWYIFDTYTNERIDFLRDLVNLLNEKEFEILCLRKSLEKK